MKLNVRKLGFDLIVCGLEKVTPAEKPLNEAIASLVNLNESITFEKLLLVSFRYFIPS